MTITVVWQLTPLRGTPANIRIYLIFLETTVVGLHFAADNIGLSLLKCLCWASVNFCLFPREWRFGRSRSSKVIDFGLNLAPIESACATSYSSVIVTLVLLFTVSEILQLLCAPDLTAIPHFGSVPVGPDRSRWGQPEHKPIKLFGREIICEEFQPVITVPKRYRQADRQTGGQIDDMQSHNRALRNIAR